MNNLLRLLIKSLEKFPPRKPVRRQFKKAKNEEEERQKKARKSMNEKKKKTVKPRNSCSICSQFVTSTSKTKKNNKK